MVHKRDVSRDLIGNLESKGIKMSSPLTHVRLVAVAALMITLNTGYLHAQDDSTFVGWKKSLTIDFTTTQTAYSDSWAGSEAGSVNWVTNLNGAAENQLRDWFNLRSTLKMSYGQTYTQDAETNHWARPQKSTDLIDWENVGRFTFNWFVDPYVALRVETQFYDELRLETRAYLSPMTLTQSAGVARKLYERGDDFITSRLGLGVRETITKAISDSAANSSGFDYTTTSSTVMDGGFESVTDATLSLSKNLRYTGKLTLFKAVAFSERDAVKGTPQEDDWKALDVNLENIFAATVTKIITVNFYTQFLYDKQINKSVRIKETLALGFVFHML
jgi:hypothetical protein